MIHKNMTKKYMVIMVGIMLAVMLVLFMVLGESAASSMVVGPMILVMILMFAVYLFAMLLLMKPKKGQHIHDMRCANCGEELTPGILTCPSCGHENKMVHMGHDHHKLK